MVNKFVKLVFAGAAFFVASVIGIELVDTLKGPAPAPVSFELTVYPIEGSDGDFMVELPDGTREVLKKGGVRHPATVKDVK